MKKGDVVTLCEEPDDLDEGPGWLHEFSGLKITLVAPYGVGRWSGTCPQGYSYSFLESWFVGSAPEPSPCSCSIPQGCKCGVFKAEMTARGMVYDQWLRSYVKSDKVTT